jgi:hypothetical protein
MDKNLPLVRGERLGDACSLHVLDVEGPPLIHATRSDRPEIVFFGTDHPVEDGLRAEAGTSIVVVVHGVRARVSRFVAGEADRTEEVAARADEIVRAIIDIGGTYPDAVQFLQQASSAHALGSRVAFDALPREFDGRQSIHEEASRQYRDMPDSPTDDDPASAVGRDDVDEAS